MTLQLLALGSLLFFSQMFLRSLLLAQFPCWVETVSTLTLAPTDVSARHTFSIVSRASHWQSRYAPYFDDAPQATFVQIFFHEQGASFIPSVQVDRARGTYDVEASGKRQARVGDFGRVELISWLRALPVDVGARRAEGYAETMMRVLNDNVDMIKVTDSLDAQLAEETATGRITMPLRNLGDFRNSLRWSDIYLGWVFLGLSLLLWLFLAYRIVRRQRSAFE